MLRQLPQPRLNPMLPNFRAKCETTRLFMHPTNCGFNFLDSILSLLGGRPWRCRRPLSSKSFVGNFFIRERKFVHHGCQFQLFWSAKLSRKCFKMTSVVAVLYFKGIVVTSNSPIPASFLSTFVLLP